MSQIKYVFRDFRGVVAKLDPKADYIGELSRAYKIPREEFKTTFSEIICQFRRGEVSRDKVFETISGKLNVKTPKTTKEIFNKMPRLFAHLYKNTVRFVYKLKKNGYTCVILSDDNKPQTLKLRKIGRYDAFDDLILSCDVGLSKRDDQENGTTKIFEYALKRYNIKANEAIFIDDTEKNCKVAEKIGIKSVVFTSPSTSIKKIKAILATK